MSFLARLTDPAAGLAFELRPPRADLAAPRAMDSWFAMNAAVQRAAGAGRTVFLTDAAVGTREEESLHHLLANLGDEVPRDGICPFLTTKHDLEYCLWFAARAAAERFPALVVVGGDQHVGPPRCVPHGYLLRQRIRERFPDLLLGAWANPHADPEAQVGWLLDSNRTADFHLTQVVSHHSLTAVDRFLAVSDRRSLDLPGVFGVFHYRSASPATLKILADYFPVPARELTREFAEGVPPAEICARSIRALRERGVRSVYVSNLDANRAAEELAAIEALV